MKTHKPRMHEITLWIVLILVTAILLSLIDIGLVSTPYTEF